MDLQHAIGDAESLGARRGAWLLPCERREVPAPIFDCGVYSGTASPQAWRTPTTTNSSWAGLRHAIGRLAAQGSHIDRGIAGSQDWHAGRPSGAEAFGVADSVLQVHDSSTVRAPTAPSRTTSQAVPFCTFDYKRFCQGMLGQVRARFPAPR